MPARPDALTYTVREPVGVVAAIVPWNFPLMIGMWKIAPALACGCTLDRQAGGDHAAVGVDASAELALEAGVPPGVLNIVTGKGSVVGDALVAHPGIDKVTFTGSPSVGRGILQGAAGNFKRVTLELGGKSANVIFADANLDARRARGGVGHLLQRGAGVFGGLARAGPARRCTTKSSSGSRSARSRSSSAIRRSARRRMGPLISAKQMKTVLDYVDIGKSEGASLVTGGAADRASAAYFVEPTVFANVEHEMRISQEEIFGPVVERDSLRRRSRRRAHRQRHAV